MTQLQVAQILANALELTPEERARLAAAPFLSTPEAWREHGAVIHEKALEGYAAGDMDLRRLLEVMRAGSLGCYPRDRRMLIWLTVERALRIKPKYRGVKYPRDPQWLRELAGDLVRAIEKLHPDELVSPSLKCDSPPVLETALAWLTTLGLSDASSPIRPKTLYGWYLERQRAAEVVLRPGRKAKHK